MLHLRCGDDILPALAQAGLPGRTQRWADPLCEGPWPSTDRGRVRPLRARYLAERFDLSFMATLDDLTRDDDALAEAVAEEEVVLWFEHDLFDQAILAWLLHELAPLADRVRLSLVEVDGHPSVARFVGLGQLAPATLAELFRARVAITDATLARARAAVAAWTADEPGPLHRLRAPDAVLPHLGPAIERYLREYPALGSGLALTERWALDAVRAGAADAARVFAAVQEREARPWLGDRMLFSRLRQLAEGVAPLLDLDGDVMAPAGGSVRVVLTALGERVLAGEADWLALQQQERWMGGVHLRPGGVAWRWDEAAGRVVRAG